MGVPVRCLQLRGAFRARRRNHPQGCLRPADGVHAASLVEEDFDAGRVVHHPQLGHVRKLAFLELVGQLEAVLAALGPEAGHGHVVVALQGRENGAAVRLTLEAVLLAVVGVHKRAGAFGEQYNDVGKNHHADCNAHAGQQIRARGFARVGFHQINAFDGRKGDGDFLFGALLVFGNVHVHDVHHHFSVDGLVAVRAAIYRSNVVLREGRIQFALGAGQHFAGQVRAHQLPGEVALVQDEYLGGGQHGERGGVYLLGPRAVVGVAAQVHGQHRHQQQPGNQPHHRPLAKRAKQTQPQAGKGHDTGHGDGP